MTCNVCNGEGGWEHSPDTDEERWEVCQECHGKGYPDDECPYCQGTGYEDGKLCFECDGEGTR